LFKRCSGRISKVNAYVGAPPKRYDLPEEPIPADLNWDLWLGPLPATIHFNNQLDPPISLDPEVNESSGEPGDGTEMGGGFTTDWVLICSTLHNGDSEWTGMVVEHHLLETDQNYVIQICQWSGNDIRTMG